MTAKPRPVLGLLLAASLLALTVAPDAEARKPARGASKGAAAKRPASKTPPAPATVPKLSTRPAQAPTPDPLAPAVRAALEGPAATQAARSELLVKLRGVAPDIRRTL
ncbi:MAG: hypothetical protein FJZ00_12735, partial [Candidatus Sericytochromatia bacterium]|nr:hypothetical protein [Candidatus Tanganyikabacteria bacterium]